MQNEDAHRDRMASAGRDHWQRSAIQAQEQFRTRIKQFIHTIGAKAGKGVQVKPARKATVSASQHNGFCTCIGRVERAV